MVKPNRLMEVLWLDANAIHGWTHEDTVKSAISLTVGYLQKETDREIIVCSNIGTRQVLCPIAIPRGCIQSIRYFRSKLWKEFDEQRKERLDE